MDKAHEETEKLLKKLEKRITKEYRQAEREIQAKLDDYLKRFEKKDKKWQEWVKQGKKTKKQYSDWRIGQIAIGQRWEEMKKTISEDLANAHKIAESITYGYMPEVYAINHNFGTFEVEKGSLIDTSYTLYNRESVEYLLRENPSILPSPGKETRMLISQGVKKRYDKQKVQSVMIQAILQGTSIPDIATKVVERVGESDRKAAIRNARTMTTNVEAKGRIDAYKRAQAMGVDMVQEWSAVHDMRTRHAHRVADGQRVPVGSPFIIDGYEMERPGDPSAPGYLIYNCRCTVRGIVSGLEPMARKHWTREDIGGMSWEEWKNEKKSQSNPITLPEEKAEAIRNSYILEYITGKFKKRKKY